MNIKRFRIIVGCVALFVLLPITLWYTFSYSHLEADPNEDLAYIPANKLVIRDCGSDSCSLFLEKGKTEYKGETILNPQTQTFQARFYTTDEYTWGFGGGIGHAGGNEFFTVKNKYRKGLNYKGEEFEEGKHYIVQNITDEYTGEYRKWYWYSFLYDFGIVAGIPLGILIILGIIVGISNGFANAVGDGLEFLDTKEGKKLLKKVDKNIRKRN